MLTYIPADISYLKTLGNNSIILDKQNQIVQEKVLSTAPVCRITAGMNTLIHNQHSRDRALDNHSGINILILDKKRKLTICQHFVDFDVVNNGRLFVTTMKPRNFQVHISTIPT